MLARWAASRSFPHSRCNALISTSRRTFFHGPPRSSLSQGQARLSTWSSRAFYRKDGTPRSKAKGLMIGLSFPFKYLSLLRAGTCENVGFFAIVFLGASSAVEMIEELEDANLILCYLVHIQRMDTEFSSLDVTDFDAVLKYFLSVNYFRAEEQTDLFDSISIAVNDLTGEKREELHTIMRKAIEEIHQILIDSKGQDPLETGCQTLCSFNLALCSLSIILDHEFVDNDFVRRSEMYAQGMTPKDRAPKRGDYEVVG
ncbi:hypothetical protein C0989_008169 [Termitomyces sp. Mn162]|nr:hypothetical protein C0989_008169 [Termitomyces sp. Mn162]